MWATTASGRGRFSSRLSAPSKRSPRPGLLPAANVRNLMLDDEVVDAVRRGGFHIWPVATIDEGIALLTGVAAGERGPDGAYPPETVHGRVLERLRQNVERLRELNADERGTTSVEAASGPDPGA